MFIYSLHIYGVPLSARVSSGAEERAEVRRFLSRNSLFSGEDSQHGMLHGGDLLSAFKMSNRWLGEKYLYGEALLDPQEKPHQ